MAATNVRVRNERGKWMLTVNMIPDLPIPLFLGKNWPSFPKLLPAIKMMRYCGQHWRSGTHPIQPHDVCLAGEQEDDAWATEGEPRYRH